MNSDWMAMQSFHRSQELLTAINELSIHLKLEAAGIADPEQTERAEAGKKKTSGVSPTVTAVVGNCRKE